LRYAPIEGVSFYLGFTVENGRPEFGPGPIVFDKEGVMLVDVD
jgi:hypothetical protein